MASGGAFLYYEEVTVRQPATMEIYIVKLTGRKLTIGNVTPNTTILEIKKIAADNENLDPALVRLLYLGKIQDENSTLGECKVVNGAVLHMLFRQVGGNI